MTLHESQADLITATRRFLQAVSRWCGPVIAVVAIGYVSRVLLLHWTEFTVAVAEASVAALGLAAGTFLASTALLGFAWISLVSGLGGEKQLRLGLWKVYARSWLARYVPGKVVGSLTRVHGAQQLGYPVPLVVASLMYEVALRLPVGMACGAFLLLMSGWVPAGLEVVLKLGLLVAVVALGVTLSIPLPRLRILHDHGLQLSRRITVTVISLFLAANLLGSLGVAVLVPRAAGGTGMLYVMGAGSLSTLVGAVSALAPAGIGVREGILTALLTPMIGAPAGLSVAVLSRILRIVTDLLFFGTCYVFDRAARR